MGKAVPADVWVNEKEVDIDQSAMTGESLPVTMYEGDIAKMGSNVMRGEVEGTVQVHDTTRSSGCVVCSRTTSAAGFSSV